MSDFPKIFHVEGINLTKSIKKRIDTKYIVHYQKTRHVFTIIVIASKKSVFSLLFKVLKVKYFTEFSPLMTRNFRQKIFRFRKQFFSYHAIEFWHTFFLKKTKKIITFQQCGLWFLCLENRVVYLKKRNNSR